MQTPDLIQALHLSETQQDERAWTALDDAAEWTSFSQSNKNQPDEWESRLAIEGMHCAACAFKVEKALMSVPGVASVEVNATSGRASVVWSSNVTKPSAWLAAVRAAGYRALPAADAFTLDSRKKNQRLMLWRWLAAGFCMMQVMMYAYPAYTSTTGDLTSEMRNLLRWASWILTLPVLIFSSGPFFSSAINDIKQRQISMDLPVALGILITFLVSTAATFEPSGWWGKEVYFDSLTMFVFFLLTGRLLELRMRDKTAGALDALMQRLPASVELQKVDGSFERVAVRRLAVGDVVRVLPGESFPADGTIVLGNTNADEALLTGESHAVPKELGAQIIGGSYNLTSAVQVRIDQIGQSTKYGQIVALMERVSVEKPRLALLADRIAKPFLLMVLIAAAASAIYWWPTDHGRALMAAVAVLIVTCPCALSLATPAAMLTTSGALARAGILVRKMQAIEALTTVDTIVFDKTGTLTNADIAVGQIKTAESVGSAQALKMAATMAKHSLHPVSRALLLSYEISTYEKAAADFDETITDVKEVVGFGLSAHATQGELKLGSYHYCVAEGALIEQVNAADSTVYLMLNNRWLASFSLAETIKPDAAAAVKQLREGGLQVEVLSGDKQSSVASISSAIGITQVQGDCTPQDKLNYMQALQKQGRKVMMVGDGLNDGPVLASASVSVAMGSAVPLAQAQSDFVILSGQLMMLPQLIAQAKRTMRVVKQNLLWAALYNATCVPLAVAGLLPAWLAGLGMALSSLLVILNAVRLNKVAKLY